MAKLLKLRRGTTVQHTSGSGFTGAEGEVTVDTTKDTLVVHDNATAGGHPVAKEMLQKTTVQHSSFTGTAGEVTIDTDKDTAVVHDGSTAGGFPLAKASDVPVIPIVTSLTYPTEGGVLATALEATTTDIKIKSLTITTAGTGYSGAGTLSATGGSGSGFTGTYTESGGAIASVTITNDGTGYTSVPTIVVSGSTSGTAAVITAETLQTLLINGSLFTTTVTVSVEVGGTWFSLAGTTSVNGAKTVITCTNVTKQAAGDNNVLRVTNSDGHKVDTTVNFSADPAFTTAADLGIIVTGTTADIDIVVTGDGTLSWYEGSPAMPAWMTHFADADTGTTKTLTGTVANTGEIEIQTFNIIVKDSQAQLHSRDFSLTVSDFASVSTNSGGVGIIDSYTGYRSHYWTTVGTHTDSFTLYATRTVSVLAIGGGGGGGGGSGSSNAGGGGAGGFRTGDLTLAAGDYTVIVGAGGIRGVGGGDAVGATNALAGGNGGISTFETITVNGGGGGGPGNTTSTAHKFGIDAPSPNGGSGGGGAGYGDSGSGADGGTYGNDGGEQSGIAGSGGGGAGGDGGDGSGSTAGVGGIGTANNYLTGVNITYCVGGEGGEDWVVGTTNAQKGAGGGGGGRAVPGEPYVLYGTIGTDGAVIIRVPN